MCHSVRVSEDDGAFVASSPDEKALLEVSREHGFAYVGESAEGEIKGEWVKNCNGISIFIVLYLVGQDLIFSLI